MVRDRRQGPPLHDRRDRRGRAHRAPARPHPEPAACEADGWRAAPAPSAERLLVRGVRDLVGEQLGLVQGSLRAATSPTRAARRRWAGRSARHARRRSFAAGGAREPAQPAALAAALAGVDAAPARRPAARQAHFGMTVNDVLLAAVAGGMRTYMLRRREEPVALKAMVPVNVRGLGQTSSDRQPDLLRVRRAALRRAAAARPPLQGARRDDASASATARRRAPTSCSRPPRARRPACSARSRGSSRARAPSTSWSRTCRGRGRRCSCSGARCRASTRWSRSPSSHAVSVGMTTVRDQACFGDLRRPPGAPGRRTCSRATSTTRSPSCWRAWIRA